MGKGGQRPGAGRPAGSVNQRNAEFLEALTREGETPLEYMLSVMRDTEADPKARSWAAEKSAPYVHPRPAPIERTVQIDLPSTATIAGIEAALDEIVAAMGSGELSPSEGQSFMSVIETRRKAIETGDLLARIEALETPRKDRL